MQTIKHPTRRRLSLAVLLAAAPALPAVAAPLESDPTLLAPVELIDIIGRRSADLRPKILQ